MAWLLCIASVVALSQVSSTAPSFSSDYDQMKSIMEKIKTDLSTKEHCRVIPFHVKIKEENSDYKLIALNACEGICKSSFIPLNETYSNLCTSDCIPNKIENHTMILSNKTSFDYTVVTSCACGSQKCDLVKLEDITTTKWDVSGRKRKINSLKQQL